MLVLEINGARAEAVLGVLRRWCVRYEILTGPNPPGYFEIMVEVEDEAKFMLDMKSLCDAYGVQLTEES